VCSPTCDKISWREQIRKIFGQENIDKIGEGQFELNIEKITNMIEQIKLKKEHKDCPAKVPISYAKGRIKYSAGRTQGYRNKKGDSTVFLERMNIIENMNVGDEFIIDDIREQGVYGQEYRDSANYGVCLGKLSVEYKQNKQGKEYSLFKRVDKNQCKHLDVKDIVIDYCQSCKKKVDGQCVECYSKGKNKGQNHLTIKKLSNKDICQLPRGMFIQHGKK
jgi:hypothetical protein